MQPVFESLIFKEKRADLKEQVKAECVAPVKAEDISRVLGVDAFCSATERELGDKRLEFGGRVVFYFVYADKNGEAKKSECFAEFKGTLEGEDLSPDKKFFFCCKVEKTEWNAYSGGVKLGAIVSVSASFDADREVSYLTGGDGLVVKTAEKPVVRCAGLKKGNYPAEEEFELDFPVKEVLWQKAEVSVLSVTCGVGAIQADCEINLSALVLQNGEKSDIIKIERSFPLRMETDYEEAMPSCNAILSACVKSFKTDVTVDADAGKSSVSLNAHIAYACEAFCEETVTLAEDAFSEEEEIETVSDGYTAVGASRNACTVKSVTGIAEADGTENGASLTACGCENVVLTGVSEEKGKLRAEGVIETVSFFTGEDGAYSTVKTETPFSEIFDISLPEGCKFTATAAVKNVSAKLVSITQIEISADVILSAEISEESTLPYLKQVTATGKKVTDGEAVTVYIPYEGEELWSLSKRLGVCPDKLLSTNKDLNFPLEGKERILIYRQK